MEKLKVLLGCAGNRPDGCVKEGNGNVVHVLAVPYPAHGHIVPLMQLCRKLATESGLMITFVNTMHNHARMLQADQAASDTYVRDDRYRKKHITNLKKAATGDTAVAAGFTSNSSTNINHSLRKRGTDCTESSDYSSKINPDCAGYDKNPYPHSSPDRYKNGLNDDRLNPNCEINSNIRLVGIPGGLPPELHGDPEHVVAAFQASEALRDPLQKLIQKLNHEGPPVSCIVSDVLVSWTQDCADQAGVPRFAFWTSSATVYHVIRHMYGLISQGMPTFKEACTTLPFEHKNTEMVSCIPGLPPMDLNDLPIIVRSDPADFIYQFLARQLKSMERAAAVLINTFHELEEHCLQALPRTCPAPVYSIGPLLPPQALQAASVARAAGSISGECVDDRKESPADKYGRAGNCVVDDRKESLADKYGRAAGVEKEDDVHAAVNLPVVISSDGGDRRCCGSGTEAEAESTAAGKGTRKDGEVVGRVQGSAAPRGKAEKADGKAGKADGKAGKQGGGKAEHGCRGGSAGIFDEDVSCLEWLDRKEPGSVLYISFGSIFTMIPEQFTELVEGLQASKQAFLWSIRPGFQQGSPDYAGSLPPRFLDAIADRGRLVSWVPQLTVLAHPSVGGFLTHCGWNSTLESVALGVPMLCWPDIGERRTNGRLAVSQWGAGLEFACAVRENGLLIGREEVQRVIRLLMDRGNRTASHLRARAAALQMSARHALSLGGSSTQAWSLFLHHIHGQPPS